LSNVGSCSLPNYKKILPNSDNFHRLNKSDHRAFVPGCFQQFNFFPWNQDYFDLFEASLGIFELKNILSDLEPNSFLFRDGILDKDFTARIAFQFYPSGYGYLNKHSDPVAGHQFALPNMVMSKKGRDYEVGGSFFERDGKRIYHEDYCEEGDVVFFDASLPHGVELIDPEVQKPWLSYSGRWMGLFSVNKFAFSKAIEDSKTLE
jgi:hypothetical protein